MGSSHWKKIHWCSRCVWFFPVSIITSWQPVDLFYAIFQEGSGRVMTAKDLLRQLQQIDDLLGEWEFRLFDAVLDKGR